MYTSLQYVHFDFTTYTQFHFICKSNFYFFIIWCTSFAVFTESNSKKNISSSHILYNINEEYQQNEAAILHCVLGVTNVESANFHQSLKVNKNNKKENK